MRVVVLVDNNLRWLQYKGMNTSTRTAALRRSPVAFLAPFFRDCRLEIDGFRYVGVSSDGNAHVVSFDANEADRFARFAYDNDVTVYTISG